MRNSLFVAMLSAVLMSTACASVQKTKGGIPGVVAPGVEPELVREGFIFTEGPLGMADGGLYFTDLLGANRIYRLDLDGNITVFREQSNGTNGLAFTSTGDLVGAEGRGKRISRIGVDGKATELTLGDGEKPLMAPNDLIVDAKGGIYFTDPGPPPAVLGRKAYLYYLPAGTARAFALDDGIVRPNGLTLTLDGKTLIVADSVSDTLFAFDVQSDGTVRNKRPFVRLHDIPQGAESRADGIAIDRDGRIYVTTLTGVQVFDKAGYYLGTIKVAREPSNLAFAGPGKRTLYITAREGLYRVQTLTQGPERLGK
jgi:gluconolactonase